MEHGPWSGATRPAVGSTNVSPGIFPVVFARGGTTAARLDGFVVLQSNPWRLVLRDRSGAHGTELDHIAFLPPVATRFFQELSWIQMENGHRVNWCGPNKHHVEPRVGAALTRTRRSLLPLMQSALIEPTSHSRDRSRTPVSRRGGEAPRVAPSAESAFRPPRLSRSLAEQEPPSERGGVCSEPGWSGIVGTIQHWGCFALTPHGQVMLRNGSRCWSSNDLQTQYLSSHATYPEILNGQRVAGYYSTEAYTGARKASRWWVAETPPVAADAPQSETSWPSSSSAREHMMDAFINSGHVISRELSGAYANPGHPRRAAAAAIAMLPRCDPRVACIETSLLQAGALQRR